MSNSALKRRIAPSVALTLELQDDSGAKCTKNFRLSFDFNTKAEIEERTGLNLLTAEVWTNLSARTLSVMLWAAILANHPEYRTVDAKDEETDEGLEVIRSYMEVGNTDQVHDALWNAYFISLPKDRREALEKARAELMEATKARAEGKPVPLAPVPENPPAQPSQVEIPQASAGSSSPPSPATTSVSPSTSSAA